MDCFLEQADIDNVLTRFLLVKKIYKYFIGYLHDDYKIKPLNIALLKMNIFVRSYDIQTKWVHLLNALKMVN